MKTIGFIGGGRITRILINGLKNADFSLEKIFVVEPNEITLRALTADFPDIKTSNTDATRAASADWVFLALHPPVLMETLNSIKNTFRKDALVISLAPKITLEKIQTVLPDMQNLARMNPNAGTYTNEGYNPVCFSRNINKNIAKDLLDVFGKLKEFYKTCLTGIYQKIKP